MGRLIASAQRKGYRLYFAARYWWMDTQSGREAQIVFCSLAVLVVIFQMVHMAVEALKPAPAFQQQQAVVWWVVQIIIAVIAAIIVYATMPKVEAPKPNEGEVMTVEDGRAVPEIHGTRWIKAQFGLANKIVGRVPIKGGGKK